jgi:hypothetical protein
MAGDKDGDAEFKQLSLRQTITFVLCPDKRAEQVIRRRPPTLSMLTRPFGLVFNHPQPCTAPPGRQRAATRILTGYFSARNGCDLVT